MPCALDDETLHRIRLEIEHERQLILQRLERLSTSGDRADVTAIVTLYRSDLLRAEVKLERLKQLIR